MQDSIRKADLRLQRLFGITLAEYEKMLVAQDGVCKICKRPPGTKRLAVDHDHKFDRLKVDIIIGRDKTITAGCLPYVPHVRGFKDRKAGRFYVRRILRRMSIRGLLCTNCNRGLQKFYDKPERFEAAARYLRDFEVKHEKIISGNSTISAPNS